jgi:hypothetical protein
MSEPLIYADEWISQIRRKTPLFNGFYKKGALLSEMQSKAP